MIQWEPFHDVFSMSLAEKQQREDTGFSGSLKYNGDIIHSGWCL